VRPRLHGLWKISQNNISLHVKNKRLKTNYDNAHTDLK